MTGLTLALELCVIRGDRTGAEHFLFTPVRPCENRADTDDYGEKETNRSKSPLIVTFMEVIEVPFVLLSDLFLRGVRAVHSGARSWLMETRRDTDSADPWLF